MHELHESRHMWMDPVTDERVEKLSWNAWWWCIKSLLQQYAWVSTFVNGSWHRWASRFTLMTVTHTLTMYLGGSMHELHESGYIWMGHVTDGYVVLPAWSIEFMSHVWMSHVPCMNASTWSLQDHSAWWHRTERPHTGRIDGNDRNPSRLRMEKSHLKRHELSFSWIFIV